MHKIKHLETSTIMFQKINNQNMQNESTKFSEISCISPKKREFSFLHRSCTGSVEQSIAYLGNLSDIWALLLQKLTPHKKIFGDEIFDILYHSIETGVAFYLLLALEDANNLRNEEMEKLLQKQYNLRVSERMKVLFYDSAKVKSCQFFDRYIHMNDMFRESMSRTIVIKSIYQMKLDKEEYRKLLIPFWELVLRWIQKQLGRYQDQVKKYLPFLLYLTFTLRFGLTFTSLKSLFYSSLMITDFTLSCLREENGGMILLKKLQKLSKEEIEVEWQKFDKEIDRWNSIQKHKIYTKTQ